MTNPLLRCWLARILFWGILSGGLIAGILLAFFVLLFLEGGIDLVLRAWKEELSAEGYKLKGVVAVIVGILVGGNIGESLARAVLRRTGLLETEQSGPTQTR